MIIQTRMRDFVKLHHFLVCQLTVSFNTLLSMHVPPCRRTTLPFVREVSATLVIFLLLQQKYVTQTSSKTFQWLFHSVCIHAECIPSTHGQEMMCVRQYPHVFNFFPMGFMFCFFPAIFEVIHIYWQKQPLFPMNERTFPIRNFLPSKF